MRIEPLAVPTGRAILDILARLRAALDGGAPIAPYAAGSPPPDLPPHDPAALPHDLAVVIATSGSTGTPKLTMLGRDSLRASIDATHDRLDGPGQWLLAVPGHHIAGLQVLLRSLIADTTPAVLDTTHSFTPAAFIEATTTTRRSTKPRYISLVPTQLARILTDADATARLADFDAALIGGAATDPALLDRARTAGITAVTTYGMSETAGGCVYDRIPLAGVGVATDHDGRVHLTGPVVAHGYLADPAHTAAAFRPGPTNHNPPSHNPSTRTFVTDDLGHLDDDGALHIEGRIDDLIITGGLKVAPRVVEEAARTLDAVTDAVAVSQPDPEWGQIVALAVILRDAHAPSEVDITTELRGILPAHAVPKKVVTLRSIPSRGPGKPDRAAVRELLTDMGE